MNFEHFFPDYVDAQKHNPNQITLLCPNHHQQVTSGMISKELVAQKSVHPAALLSGYSYCHHPFFFDSPTVIIGGVHISNCPVPIRLDDDDVLKFIPPESVGEPLRIDGLMRSPNGQKMVSIIDNEWRVHSGNWTFESIGPRYIFRNESGIEVLNLKINAPDTISVERANLYGLRGSRFIVG